MSKIVFADVAGFVPCFADIHRVLEAFEILVGQLQGRFGKFDVDELSGDAESKAAFVVVDLRSCDGCLVFGCLQAVLSLLAALEQIADTQVELRRVVDVIGGELARLEDGKELRIAQEHGIGAQIRRGLFGLTLLDGGARRHQVVVMLQRHLNGVVERYGHRSGLLRERLCLRGRRSLRRCGLRIHSINQQKS